MTSRLNELESRGAGELFHRYRSLFCQTPELASPGEHRLVLRDDRVPQSCRPYRIPEALKREVGGQIDKLLKEDLIYVCESPFA